MKTLDRDEFIEAIEAAGLDPEYAVREEYSGRGMYGEQCVGVVIPRLQGVFSFLIELTAISEDECRVSRIEMRTLVRTACMDDMGTSKILYFPGYQLAEDNGYDIDMEAFAYEQLEELSDS